MLQRLKQAKILVVGDVILDSYYKGDTERIANEAPTPIVHVKSQAGMPKLMVFEKICSCFREKIISGLPISRNFFEAE